MGVGTQVIIIMFDDNKITVTAQCVTGIDNAPVCGRDDDCPSFTACDIDPFVAPSEVAKFSIILPSVGQRHVVIDELAF